MTNDESTDLREDMHEYPRNHPHVMPVPVSVEPRRLIILTRLFGWLTAFLLASAVTISLHTITSNRDALQDQIDFQNTVSACRSEAATQTDLEVARRQILIGEESVAVSELVLALVNDPDADFPELSRRVEEANRALIDSRRVLQEAINNQRDSLLECLISD